ncbi:Chitotriosidase-1, partial [Lamellibrachia satsuma]
YSYKRICYYTTWSKDRTDTARFLAADIDTSLCTHIVYAFVNVTKYRLSPFRRGDTGRNGGYAQVNALKRNDRSLKTLLSVGGWDMGTRDMKRILSNRWRRRAFIRNSIAYLRANKFDGFDLNFEYPGSRGSPASDKRRFTFLCKDKEGNHGKQRRKY